MGKDWFNIRVKTEASKFDAVRSKIQGWPEEVAKEVYWPMLREIAARGRDYIREIILASTTPTGEQRARAGGKGPGRVKTGNMYNSVTYRARERKAGFSLFVGWIEGRPGYAIFQELGTGNGRLKANGQPTKPRKPSRRGVNQGVVGMNAIQQAQEYMLSELRAMARGVYKGSSDGKTMDFGDDE